MTARAKPGPLMASLAQVRQGVRVSACSVAAELAVSGPMVSRWESGYRSPSWHYLVAYAAQLRRRVVARDGSTVLAEGLDVPGMLTVLRRHVGLKQCDVAVRLTCGRTSVSMFESRTSHQLASIERYITVGLSLQLSHMAAS